MQIIAHRGASRDAPENTLAAFALARAQNADAIELDVRLTRDRVPVVLHDETLERIDGSSRQVREVLARELALLRLGGEPIPTLAEVLASAERPPGLVLELKSDRAADLGAVREVAALLSTLDDTRRARIVASSFNPLCLLRFRCLAPGVSRAMLGYHAHPLPLRRLWAAPLISPRELHLDVELATPRRVAWAHRRGLRVVAWTVNEASLARRLAASGVDAVITDVPAALRAGLSSGPSPGRRGGWFFNKGCSSPFPHYDK